MNDMNVRVAIDVMGWERIEVGYIGGTDETPRQRELAEWIDDVGLEDVGAYYIDIPAKWFIRVDAWEPSHNIRQAKRVIARMAELGYWCQMRTPREKTDKPDYRAGFTPHGFTGWNGVPDHWTQAETLEMAICEAALATLAEGR